MPVRRNVLEILKKLFHSKQDFSLLDVGCGFGDFCGYLQDEGYQNIQFTGLDINERMTAESKKRFPEQEFVTGLVEALPAHQRYDYAIASGVYSLRRIHGGSAGFFL
jgi:ubiquinone/menaquinone biosynthesis C-methylase UbiE